MAKPYGEITRSLSRKLLEDARHAGVLDHRGGKGDAREVLLRAVLKERVGTRFSAEKAELLDANGRTSPQFDAVVYDCASPSCIHRSESSSSVIRIESVACVIEVKSRLEPEKAWEEARRINSSLAQMKRYFAASLTLKSSIRYARESKSKKLEERLAQGISASESDEYVPAIGVLLFAYDGADDGSAAVDLVGPDGFEAVCVLGKYTTIQMETKGIYTHGDNALASFLAMVEVAVHQHRSASILLPPDPFAWLSADIFTEPGR